MLQTRKAAGRKRNTAGFTMVEIAVAMLLAAILGMCLISVLAPVYRVYQRTVNRAESFSIGENVIECIRQGAMRARQVALNDDPDQPGVKTSLGLYTMAGGQLVFLENGKQEPQPLFDGAYYGGRSVAMTAAPVEGDAAGVPRVAVTVTVTGAEMAPCTVTGIVSSLWCVLND